MGMQPKVSGISRPCSSDESVRTSLPLPESPLPDAVGLSIAGHPPAILRQVTTSPVQLHKGELHSHFCSCASARCQEAPFPPSISDLRGLNENGENRTGLGRRSKT